MGDWLFISQDPLEYESGHKRKLKDGYNDDSWIDNSECSFRTNIIMFIV